MNFNSGNVSATVLSGTITATATQPTFTQVGYLSGVNLTAGVGAGKRWRIVSANCMNAGTTDASISIASAADAVVYYIARLDNAAGINQSANVAGDCVAIVAATQKIRIDGVGTVVYIEETA